MERLCSSFGVALRYIGSHAPRENNQPMVSRDWAEQHIHECIVGSPCRFCPALNLGLRAISLTLEICEGRAWSQKKATKTLVAEVRRMESTASFAGRRGL